ncbi:MAG: ABC transporter permease subunit [Planctomycetes bacterium]|nr:ABC transporter permease subunit [Planctomycetota bacterium]
MSELRKSARQARTYVFRAAFLCLVLVVGAMIVSEWRFSSTRDPQEVYAELGQALFIALSLVTGSMALLLGPAYAGGIVAGERERRTLDTVLTSDLSNIEIVVDKLLSRLMLIGVTLVGVLPCCVALLMLGGVSWWQLLGGVTLVIAVLLFASGLGVWFSSVCGKTTRAVLLSYVVLGIYLFGIPLVVILLVESRSDPMRIERTVIPVLMLCHPLAALLGLVLGAPARAGNLAWAASYGWITTTAFCGLVFLLCSAVAALRLRSEAPSLWERLRRRLGRRRRPRPPRRVWSNPVFWRAMQTGRRWGLIGALFAAAYVLIALLISPRNLCSPGFHRITVCVEIFVLCVYVTVLGSTCVSSEREGRTLGVLVVTPYEPTLILLGKMFGVVLRNPAPLLLPVAHTACCVALGMFHPASLLCVGLIATVFTVFFLAVSLLLSAVSRTNTRSMILALFIFLCLVAFMPMLGSMFYEDWVAQVSPMGLAAAAVGTRYWLGYQGEVYQRNSVPGLLRKSKSYLFAGMVAYCGAAVCLGGLTLRMSGALLRRHV